MRINLPLWGAFFAAAAGYAATPAGADACFDNTKATVVPIMQQAPPPASDNRAGFPFYPAASFSSMQGDTIAASASSVPKYYWQWGNHGPRVIMKSNLAPGVTSPTGPTQLHFSSPAAADACTLAQTAAYLGFPGMATNYLKRADLARTTTPSPGAFTNLCVLPTRSIRASIQGVVLDYEVQDGRTSGPALAFLLEYATLVHRAGKKAILYTNPLDSGRQALSGIDATTAPRLQAAYDLMSIFLWSSNLQGDIARSFTAQMAVLGAPDPAKLYVNFELSNTTLADARRAFILAKTRRLAAIMLWRNGAAQGGACNLDVNRKIACLAYGRCR